MTTSLLIIVAHRDLQSSRINRGLLNLASSYKSIRIHQLYEEYPDFFVDSRREQELLVACDALVLQYPLYWYSCPALLKEWIDVVWARGFAWGAKGTALRGKPIQHVVTTGGPVWARFPSGLTLPPYEEILGPFALQANLAGMEWQVPMIVPASAWDDIESRMHISKQYLDLIQRLTKGR